MTKQQPGRIGAVRRSLCRGGSSVLLFGLSLAGCSGDDEAAGPVRAAPEPPVPASVDPSATVSGPDAATATATAPVLGVAPGGAGGPSLPAGTGGAPPDPTGAGGQPLALGGAGGADPMGSGGLAPMAGGAPTSGGAPTRGLAGSSGAPAPADDSFDIEFEYRYDSAGWYDDARQQLLVEAASRWTRFIASEFATVPAGTNLRARPPEEMLGEAIYLQLEYDIDDLVIMPGSDGDYDGTERFARTGVSATTQDVEPTLAATLIHRYQEHPSQPWIATLTFDPTYPWFLDPTPEDASDLPSDMADFLNVAVHELGHALGLGTLGAFNALISEQTFVGPKAMELYGGPVPMEADGHLQKDLTYDGQYPIMESGTALGQRKTITALDLAMLEDIG